MDGIGAQRKDEERQEGDEDEEPKRLTMQGNGKGIFFIQRGTVSFIYVYIYIYATIYAIYIYILFFSDVLYLSTSISLLD